MHTLKIPMTARLSPDMLMCFGSAAGIGLATGSSLGWAAYLPVKHDQAVDCQAGWHLLQLANWLHMVPNSRTA